MSCPFRAAPRAEVSREVGRVLVSQESASVGVAAGQPFGRHAFALLIANVEHVVPHDHAPRVRTALERLRRALVDVMPEDVIPSWLETECKALGGLKPIEVLERGEIDRLWRTIFFLGSGVPS
jgi:hypothetical protein